MSQESDPSEYQSHGSPEHPRSGNSAPRSHTADRERDPYSDSDADSHRPVPPPRTGLRVRTTARKSVPIPTRVSFRVPARDEAGPSRARSRSRSSSSSPPPYRPSSPIAPAVRPPPVVQPPPVVRPPPVLRAPIVHMTGMTPGERGEVARIARGQRLHRSLILHHDQTIDALIATAGAESHQMNQIVALLGHTMDSLSHLYAVVYMVMALAVVAFGSVWWARS